MQKNDFVVLKRSNSNKMNKIARCELYYVKIPLDTPYVLSFATVNHVDVVVVRICLNDGRCGVAEAVPLPGYTKDTLESIIGALKPLACECIGMSSGEAKDILAKRIPDDLIALSAILTAIEIATDAFALPDHLDVPLLAPVSASRFPENVLNKSLHLIEDGYRTIKFKIGRDLEADCMTASLLLDELPNGIRLRIDANQGYEFAQAEIFLDILRHPRNHLVELVEQPFPPSAWNDFEKLAKKTDHVRLMLDESIVVENDIERAAAVGANLVKLKLCKHSGLLQLRSMAERAKMLGMDIVLGNGVATDLGNIQEAALFQDSDLFAGAYEGNGFAKLTSMILTCPPIVVDGRMHWHNDVGRRIDELVDYQRMDRIR